MRQVRAEYKLLIGLGVVFTFILLFSLIKTNSGRKVLNKYKESKLVTCKSETLNKGIEYTNYICTIKDESGNSYTVSYPQLKEENNSIKKINQKLKSDFDTVYNTVKYYDGEKLELLSYQTTNFKIYHSNGLISLLIEKKDMVSNVYNKVNQYDIYNIDASTYDVLTDEEVKKKVGIDSVYSSKLRGKLVVMYLRDFKYDYNNATYLRRNDDIDDTIGNITYSSIQNVYIDDDGNAKFIMYLYNPNYGEKIPYQFTLDKNMNTTYEIIQI